MVQAHRGDRNTKEEQSNRFQGQSKQKRVWPSTSTAPMFESGGAMAARGGTEAIYLSRRKAVGEATTRRGKGNTQTKESIAEWLAFANACLALRACDRSPHRKKRANREFMGKLRWIQTSTHVVHRFHIGKKKRWGRGWGPRTNSGSDPGPEQIMSSWFPFST